MEDAMLTANPWSLVVRGIVALIFGLLLVLWPGLTIATLILLFAAFAIIDGIMIIIMAMVDRKRGPMWTSFIPLGIVGIVLGILILVWPGMTLLILIYLIAAWALISGIGQIVNAFAVKNVGGGVKTLLVIVGLLTVILGVLIFIYPISTTAILIWILGFYLLIYGIFAMLTGFWLNSANKKTGPPSPATP